MRWLTGRLLPADPAHRTLAYATLANTFGYGAVMGPLVRWAQRVSSPLPTAEAARR